ncbi:reverse transcriptase domain-containing protein [Tanacetum coccineum]
MERDLYSSLGRPWTLSALIHGPLAREREGESEGEKERGRGIDPEGKEYTYALRFEFETTNNEAEYEALLVGLRIAQEMEITKVAIFLAPNFCFEDYTVEHVRMNQNKKADTLSKLASMTLCLRGCPIFDRFHLGWIHMYAFAINDMSEKLYFQNPKFTF